MEVQNKLNYMRFSPVLLAVITAAASVGLSSPAQAQQPEGRQSPAVATAPSQTAKLSEQPDAAAAANTSPDDSGLAVEPHRLRDEQTAARELALLAQAMPDPAADSEDADASNDPPVLDPAAPPPGSQTPVEETPNQLQFDITPDSTGPELDLPQTAPSPEVPAPAQPAPGTGAQPEEEARVLISEVLVTGVEGDLENIVYDAIRTQPGRTTTRSQLQEDINAIFATGLFSNVRALPEDTPLGVRVTFDVQANPILRSVQVEGNEVLPQTVVDEIFQPQYGSILNLRQFQDGVEQLNQWYQSNGYVLAQVVAAPQVEEDGTVTLAVAEGVIEDIEVLFLNDQGESTDADGNPIDGKTRDFIITREFESQSGDVFNQQSIEQDLQRVFGLGIFEDVRISLNPGDDPRKVDVIVNVTERSTGSVAAGLGFSSSSGIFGSISYQQQNLGGNNQNLGAELQVGEREFLFDVRFTDPWIAGDPYRTSYTVNVFNRRSISLIFDGGDREVRLPDPDDLNDIDSGDRPRVNRIGGGLSFSRPLDDWLGLEGWRASAGLQYQRVSIRDSDGDISPRDALGNDLSFSGSGTDDLLTLQFGAVRDRRNNAIQPTSGSLLRFGTEQSIPVGSGSILLNRLRASYSYYMPVRYTRFTEGCRAPESGPTDCPQTLAFNVQAGTILGDLPPYEAFSLGGTDSVRGYDSGEVGAGRSFLQATAEYRFPLFAIVGGALFVDVGTDLGTGDNVPGNPAGAREKPGNGFGYGLGVRVQSPLGPIRVDYGFNDRGDTRLHFGIGERF